MPELSSKLEALLFVYGEALSIKKAAGVLGISTKEVLDTAGELKKNLEERKSGLTVMTHDESLQLVTRGENAQLLEQVVKAELNESLTPAALETLAIITYAGPITRAEIDYIRGVNSSYTVRALAMRGLINREADPKRANAYIYQPSADLIRHLGVESVQALPEYERLRSVSAKIISAPKTDESSAPTES